jgi:hypothetical protein
MGRVRIEIISSQESTIFLGLWISGAPVLRSSEPGLDFLASAARGSGAVGTDFDCEQVAIAEYPRSTTYGIIRTMSGTVENILRWFAGIGAAFKKPTEYFSRRRRPSSDIASETSTEGATEEVGAVATATERTVATPTVRATLVAAADATIDQNALVSRVTPILPDQQEIQRRRELVRTLFNDFWNGCDDKPAAFVDRLNQAETYLNERLTACGECWQLDAKARKMLGLPPRSNSRSQGNGAAHR